LASGPCGAGWSGERCQGRNAVLAPVNAARWLLGSFAAGPRLRRRALAGAVAPSVAPAPPVAGPAIALMVSRTGL